jgi:hypothetical protein
MSRQVLVFSRAEVNEEVLQGADYGRAKVRVSHYVRVDYEENDGLKSYVGSVHHFLRIPHPSINLRNPGPDQRVLTQPLRLAMVTFYKPRGNNPPGMVRADTGNTIKKWEYYAVHPASIMNKYVVAFEGGDTKKLCCMLYHGLTGNR